MSRLAFSKPLFLPNEVDVQTLEFPEIEDNAQSDHGAPRPLTAAIPGSISLPGDLIDADLGWREFLATMGISAAIISTDGTKKVTVTNRKGLKRNE